MNPVAISLGPLTITWYSICILLGVILAGIVINNEAKRYNIPTSFVTNLIFWCVIFGLLGARIYYVLFNLDYYSTSPIEVVKIWNGGLAIHGGIIAGLITLIVYCKKYGVDVLKMIDISVPGLILAQGIGRWGNFFNGEAHGGVVTLEYLQSLHLPQFIIDGMHINGLYYHPTFLYESLWCLLGFIFLMLIRRRKYQKVGQTTALYLIWYGIGRFFIEGLRTDSLMLNNFRVAQIVSIAFVVIGLILFIVKGLGSKFDNQYNNTRDLDEVKF